ncbi:hypothetical protein CC80DRAFT_459454, partial [Byssothecium circinans]
MPATSTGGAYQPYACDVCQSRFTRHENLKRHAALHSRSQGEAALPCDLCHATFSRPDLRNRHMKRKHPDHDVSRVRKRRRHDRHDSSSPLRVDNDDTPNLAGSLTQQTAMSEVAGASYNFSNPLIDEVTLLLGMPFLEPPIHSDQQLLQTATAPFTPFNTDLSNFSFEHGLLDKQSPTYSLHDQDDWIPSSRQLAHGCDAFFSDISHFMPFIHRPTFDATQTPDYQLLSMLCLAYEHTEDPDCGDQVGSGITLSARCFHKARVLVAREKDKVEEGAEGLNAITLVQAYLLLEVYSMMYLCGKDSTYGLRAHSKMISLARAGGLLQPPLTEAGATPCLNSLWRQFIKTETIKRTIFTLHQIDTLWYQFLSIPRSLSHLEIKHDLPCPDDYWNASSSNEWAHRQLTAKLPSPNSLVQYPDAVRRLISSERGLLAEIPPFDPYGAINLTQFLVSSAREISGWSTMTGMLSLERLEPLRTSLLALHPFMCSEHETSALCRATWEIAIIELQLWSPSHTGGIVESSINAVLYQLTYLAPSSEFLCESTTASMIQPHVDWFLRYLDAMLNPDTEAPWIVLYAYKAFMIAWQLLKGRIGSAMEAVGIADGDLRAALAWARSVFGRRKRRQLGRIILSCLDTL